MSKGTITPQQANDEWYCENSQVMSEEEESILACSKCSCKDDGFGNGGFINDVWYCENCFLDEKERIATIQENQDREDIVNGKL